MTITSCDKDSLTSEARSKLLTEAKTLIDGTHAGVLCSADDNGTPQVRWMATFSFDEFPIFYALTGTSSRKSEQIARCPQVNWMFSNADLSLILNLVGAARVLTDTPTLKRIWRQVEDKSRAYFLNQYIKGAGFVVIETTVKRIECTSPQSAGRLTFNPAEWTAT